ncbi:MAG: radical SAM protein [Anaerolineae bacterium]
MTTECNLRCRYCYAGGGNYGMRLQPMSSAVALQTVRWAQAHFAAIGTIQFFGGEPALNSRIIRTVCEAFRESSMQVSQYGIITNGVYLLVGERPETPKPQKRWADLFGHLRALSWEIFSIPLESLHGRLDTIARWFLPFLIVSVVLSTLAVWLWGGWHWATMQEMARFSRQRYNILLMLAINGFAIPFFYLFNAGVALFILGSGLWQLNKAITSHLRPLLPALVPGWTVDIVMVGIDLICLYLLRNRLRVLLAW